MKKLLLILLPILTLSLASCKPTTPLRNSGDIYDITNYETVIYCDKGSSSLEACRNCTNWYTINSEKLKTAKSITCENVATSSGYHVHYCVTWVK